MNHFSRTTLLTFALLILALCPARVTAGIVFTKVADTTTSIPDGTGVFTSLENPSIDNGRVVFVGNGAGGQTGWANPFAFTRAVRAFWKGIVVMAGGMADGHAVAAAEALGCDLAYMGTKFIATQESMAKDAYKAMLVRSRLDDVLLTRAFTGLETNMLRPSIEAAGLDPANLPSRGAIDIAKDINAAARERPDARRWKDIWSAGHAVSGVSGVPSVAELIERTAAEYAAARRSMQLVET